MIDKNRLSACMAARGYTASKLAHELGVTNATLSYKIRGKREFRLREAQAIKKILGLTSEERDAIFFAPDVDLKSTATN